MNHEPHRRSASRSGRLSVLGLVCIVGVLGGCGGSSEISRTPTSAAMVAEGFKVDRAVAGRLSSLGVGELFVPAGSFDAQGAFTPSRWPELPTGQRVALWVQVQPPAAKPEAVADQVAGILRSRILEAQSFGWTPGGVVLDLARQAPGVADLGAAFVGRARKQLGESGWVGVAVPRDAGGAWSEVAKAAQLVVWDAYGQAAGEKVDNSAWDLLSVSPRFGPIASWGRPVMARVRTLASIERGGSGESTTEITLGALARDRRLRLQEGFALSGVDRVSYEWRSEDRLRIGSWDLVRGERLFFRGPRLASLEELSRDLKPRPEFAGFVFDRIPQPTEAASMPIDSYGRILGSAGSTGSAAEGRLALELTGVRNGRTGTVRIKLNNPTSFSSEIAMMGVNYVEIEVDGGFFGDVDAGFFYRYEYLRRGETRPSMAALRRPERIRFYLPLLEAGESFGSGPIEVNFDGNGGGVKGVAEFMSQDGRPLRAPEARWAP